MIGTRLGHYEILEKIGEGGMGVVYLARDQRLQRTLAVKILPAHAEHDEDRRRRFVQEARTASALNHPNIITIYEIGSSDGLDFICMEYVRGRTLREILSRGRLSLDEVRHYGLQIADALGAAHTAGIIHRDLKPGNIMVTDAGVVKVLDFGLAKMLAIDDEPASRETLTRRTQPGAVVGTAAYMAPEQAQGMALDTRSDIFSLGVVLYEMACGRTPFEGQTLMSTLLAIVQAEPDLARVPEALHPILACALNKNPDLRYQNARELAADLHRLAGGPAPERGPGPLRAETAASQSAVQMRRRPPAIAVLPFANLSTDPGNEFFSDGLTDEIINALARVPGLRVVARTSAFQFKGKALDVKKVGETLCVDAVLEGSVQRAHDRLRAIVQLVNVANGYHLWSGRYDREVRDIFDVQTDIAQSIVHALEVRFSHTLAVPVLKPNTEDVEAYALLLQGNCYWHTQFFVKAIDCFEAALRRDPKLAAALAGLANCHIMLSWERPSRKALAQAKDAALRSLALNDSLPEAQTAAGAVLALYDLNWEAAHKAFQQAAQRNGGSALVHSGYAMAYLAPSGCFAEAIDEMSVAQDLDPLSPFVSHSLASCYYFARHFDQALGQVRRTRDLDQQFAPARVLAGRIHSLTGNHSAAIRECETAVQLDPGLTLAEAALSFCKGASGDRSGAHAILNRLRLRSGTQYVSPYALAVCALGAGLTDECLTLLNIAIEQRSGGIHLLGVEPVFDELRRDERFAVLIKALGLGRPADCRES